MRFELLYCIITTCIFISISCLLCVQFTTFTVQRFVYELYQHLLVIKNRKSKQQGTRHGQSSFLIKKEIIYLFLNVDPNISKVTLHNRIILNENLEEISEL